MSAPRLEARINIMHHSATVLATEGGCRPLIEARTQVMVAMSLSARKIRNPMIVSPKIV